MVLSPSFLFFFIPNLPKTHLNRNFLKIKTPFFFIFINMMYSLKMKNITLNIIGQRILADVLKEKEAIIKMNILFLKI